MIPPLPYKSKNWLSQPISPTCEVLVMQVRNGLAYHEFCGEPTDYVYPANPCGWVTLCTKHGIKHYPNGAYKIEDVISSGETFL